MPFEAERRRRKFRRRGPMESSLPDVLVREIRGCLEEAAGFDDQSEW